MKMLVDIAHKTLTELGKYFFLEGMIDQRGSHAKICNHVFLSSRLIEFFYMSHHLGGAGIVQDEDGNTTDLMISDQRRDSVWIVGERIQLVENSDANLYSTSAG